MTRFALALSAVLALPIGATLATPANAACVGDGCSLPDDPVAQDIARGVGRLDIRTRDGAGYCTGFIVTPRVVATSWSCVPGPMAADGYPTALTSGILLDYTRMDGSGTETRYLYIDPRHANESFGVSFLWLVDPKQAFEDDRILKLSATPRAPEQPLAALVHQEGGAMTYRSEGCVVIAPTGDAPGTGVIRHTCPMGKGTLGAPLLDPDTGEVVGIHLYHDTEGDAGVGRSAVAMIAVFPDLGAP